LKAKYGTQYSLNEAARDYAEEFGTEPRTFLQKCGQALKKIGKRVFRRKMGIKPHPNAEAPGEKGPKP
jgi:hypothetical protein